VNNFSYIINADLNWRFGEIAILKSLTVQTHMTENKRTVSRKYTVPAFYAVWEGFVVNAFTEYIRAINEKNLLCNNLHKDIVTHYLFSTLNLHQPPHEYSRRTSFIKKIQNSISEVVKIPLNVDTASNVDYKELSNIFFRYGVSSSKLEKYTAPLNKFVNYRNRIAHGDSSVTVDASHIVEFSETIISLMTDITDILIEHINREAFSVCS